MQHFQAHAIVHADRVAVAERQADGAWRYVAKGAPEVISLTRAQSKHIAISEDDAGYVIRYPCGHVTWLPTAVFDYSHSLVGV